MTTMMVNIMMTTTMTMMTTMMMKIMMIKKDRTKREGGLCVSACCLLTALLLSRERDTRLHHCTTLLQRTTMQCTLDTRLHCTVDWTQILRKGASCTRIEFQIIQNQIFN